MGRKKPTRQGRSAKRPSNPRGNEKKISKSSRALRARAGDRPIPARSLPRAKAKVPGPSSPFDKRFAPIAERLRAGGVSKNDITKARGYFERRALQRGASLDTTEKGEAYVQHHGYYYQKTVSVRGKPKRAWFSPDGSKRVPEEVAKKANTARARPAPKNGHYKYNDTYRLHRGYHYRDTDGRWRSPDGRKLVPEKKARLRNAKHNARLVREDAYYALIARGVPVKKRDFLKAVKRAPNTRTGLRNTLLESDLVRKGTNRANRASRKQAKKDVRASVGEDAYEDAPEDPTEEPGYQYDADTAFEDWYQDYEEMDGGDTP